VKKNRVNFTWKMLAIECLDCVAGGVLHSEIKGELVKILRTSPPRVWYSGP